MLASCTNCETGTNLQELIPSKGYKQTFACGSCYNEWLKWDSEKNHGLFESFELWSSLSNEERITHSKERIF